MKITRDNYESFFLDYLEGRLDINAIPELMAFLAENNDLSEELESLQLISLEAPVISFGDKSSLLIPDSIDYSKEQNLLIGAVEGDLNAQQQNQLDLLLKDDAISKELSLYKRTILEPPAIHFNSRETLYKKAPRIIQFPVAARYAAAAASIALILWFSTGQDAPSARLAHIESRNLPGRISDDLNPAPVSSPALSLNDAQHDTDYSPNVKKDAPVELIASSTNRTVPEKISRKNFYITRTITPRDPEVKAGVETDIQHVAGTTKSREEYPTILEFFEQKAKSQLWGNTTYPENDFVLALAEKAVQKRAENPDRAVVLDRRNTEQEKRWKIRIGKFEFERRKSK